MTNRSYTMIISLFIFSAVSSAMLLFYLGVVVTTLPEKEFLRRVFTLMVFAISIIVVSVVIKLRRKK